jgi:hypothetical protein
MMITSKGRDDVSELRPPTIPLFICQVIYGEPRWNDVDKGQLPIRPPEVSGNATSSHVVAKQEELRRTSWIWSCAVSLFILRRYLKNAVKSHNVGQTALLLWRKSCYSFLQPLNNLHPRPDLNPRTSCSVSSTITITLPKTTKKNLGFRNFSVANYFALSYVKINSIFCPLQSLRRISLL